MFLRRSVAVLAAIGTLALVSSAQARTTQCSGNHYLAIDPAAFPGIGNERAINLPRLTDGYAPRCLVADSVAGYIQSFFHQHSRLPRTLQIHGARWMPGPGGFATRAGNLPRELSTTMRSRATAASG